MSIDDLILLPHDQIDYQGLAPDVLLALATQQDEPFIATSALGELAARRGPEALAAVEAILAAEPWDRYLRAFAITILCGRDRERATETMARLLDDTTDPKDLGAMVECVMSDPDHFAAGPARAFADRLAATVARVAPDQFTDLDERAAFLARHGAS
jgi:hypothetical protein